MLTQHSCQRCQRYKIKCSGSRPCDTCTKRNIDCVIDDRAQKVLVSQGYEPPRCIVWYRPLLKDISFIDDLQQKVAQMEQCIDSSSPRPISDNLDDGDRQTSRTSDTVERSLSPGLTNPLSTGPSTFLSTGHGRTCRASSKGCLSCFWRLTFC